MSGPGDGYSIPFGIATQLASDPNAAINQVRALVSDPAGFVQALTIRSRRLGGIGATFTVEGKTPAGQEEPSVAAKTFREILGFLELEAVIETPAGPLPPIPIAP